MHLNGKVSFSNLKKGWGMKNILVSLFAIVLVFGVVGLAIATPMNYVENGTGLVPDNIWTHRENYYFLGSNIALAAGTYDLNFNLGGTVWSSAQVAFGWESSDRVYAQAWYGGNLVASTFAGGMSGQYDDFNLTMNIALELLDPGSLSINLFSVVSDDSTEVWRVDNATLTGTYEPAPAPIPESATIYLIGTGLVGLIGFGRKKIFKK
jgi:hypothetical protein